MDKVLLSLGLARKAGKLKTGTQSVLDAIKKGQARLVLIACDVSQNTAKQLESKVLALPHEVLPYTTIQLGDALGRPPCACVAITDIGFIKAYEQSKPSKEKSVQTESKANGRI